MSQTATASATDAKPQRHKVTGDVHLLLRRGNEVLFGQRQNTGFEDGAWHLPSGHREAGESVIDALIREADEEIGVTIEANDVQFARIIRNSSSDGRMEFFFTVSSWRGEPMHREPDKCSGVGWFAADAPSGHMIAYCRTAMGERADWAVRSMLRGRSSACTPLLADMRRYFGDDR